MNRKIVLLVFILLNFVGMGFFPLSYAADEPPYENSSIFDIEYTDEDNYEDQKKMLIQFGNEEYDSSVAYYWVEEKNNDTGSGILTFDYRKELPGYTSLEISHCPDHLVVYKDTADKVPLDGALAFDIDDTNWFTLNYTDDILENVTFSMRGSVEYFKQNPGLDQWKGVLNFQYHELEVDEQEDKTVLSWGASGTCVTAKDGDWNTNATIDFEETFYFEAFNGSATFKWDLMLENFHCATEFLEGYSIADLSIASFYSIAGGFCPGGDWEYLDFDNHDPVEYDFEGDKISDHSYKVDDMKYVNASEVSLGEFDFGDKYTWNDNTEEDIINLIGYRENTEDERQTWDNRALLLFSQNFPKFGGQNIMVDPKIELKFADDMPPVDDNILLWIIIIGFIAFGVIAVIVVVRKFRKVDEDKEPVLEESKLDE